MNRKTLWITETAVLLALLVGLQFVTKAMGQFVTGSCVNLVLGVAVLTAGLWSGVTVAVLSPFCAFLVGIGPAFLPIVPMVAVGNTVLVVLLHLLCRDRKPMAYVGMAVAAVAKFVALWLLIVVVVLPMLGLPEKQQAVLSASFTWPQLVTALIGGVLAVSIAPTIRKALQR